MCAILAPVTPEPMMTYSEDEGRLGVVRWSAMGSGGVCQYAFVGFGSGRPMGSLKAVILTFVN